MLAVIALVIFALSFLVSWIACGQFSLKREKKWLVIMAVSLALFLVSSWLMTRPEASATKKTIEMAPYLLIAAMVVVFAFWPKGKTPSGPGSKS